MNAARRQDVPASASGNLSRFVLSPRVVGTKVRQRLRLTLELPSSCMERGCQRTNSFYLVSVCCHLGLDAEHYAAFMSLLDVSQQNPQSLAGVVIRPQQHRDKLDQNSNYSFSKAVKICHSFKLALIPSDTDRNNTSYCPLVICIWLHQPDWKQSFLVRVSQFVSLHLTSFYVSESTIFINTSNN